MSDTITLYSFVNQDRSCRPRWLLHELEQPFTEQRIDPEAGEHKGEAYRQINPYGFIPGLQINGEAMGESGAICLYLADRYGYGNLAPKADDPRRSQYLQWAMFGSCTLDEAFLPLVQPGRTPQQSLIDDRVKMFATISTCLQQGPYILGSEFSAADILIAHPLICAANSNLLDGHDDIQQYLSRLAERPAAKQAGLFG